MKSMAAIIFHVFSFILSITPSFFSTITVSTLGIVSANHTVSRINLSRHWSRQRVSRIVSPLI